MTAVGGYPSSGRPASDLNPPPTGPAPGAQTDEIGPLIIAWEKPSDGWLKVTVREPLLGMTGEYYWCEVADGKPTGYGGSERVWAWRQWSMAGKPTVKVNPARSAILSNLVIGHDVLRHVGADMGIEQAAESGRNDPHA